MTDTDVVHRRRKRANYADINTYGTRCAACYGEAPSEPPRIIDGKDVGVVCGDCFTEAYEFICKNEDHLAHEEINYDIIRTAIKNIDKTKRARNILTFGPMPA